MSSTKGYTAVSLFSGCGGSDIGLRAVGINVVWANEIDATACQFYENVACANIECADVRQIDRFPKGDILVGCYPCQGYSQGGRRKSDDQINFLYQEFDRALRQTKPEAFIVENVNGMRFAQNAGLLRSQLVRFRSAGYSVKPAVLNAADFGLAQDRKRIFIVGIRSRRKKVFEFPMPSHGESVGQAKRRTLKDTISHLRKAPPGSYCEDPFHWYYLSRNRRRTWSQQAPCVVAHWRHIALHPDSPPLVKIGEDRWEFTRDPHKARRLSYLECAAIQGFPEPSRFSTGIVRDRFRVIGNAVPPPLFSCVASALVDQLNSR